MTTKSTGLYLQIYGASFSSTINFDGNPNSLVSSNADTNIDGKVTAEEAHDDGKCSGNLLPILLGLAGNGVSVATLNSSNFNF